MDLASKTISTLTGVRSNSISAVTCFIPLLSKSRDLQVLVKGGAQKHRKLSTDRRDATCSPGSRIAARSMPGARAARSRERVKGVH